MSDPLQAIIFDLDDTLYDHIYSARHGLISLSIRYPALQSVSVRELETRYSEALEAIHVRLLRGEVNQAQARSQRMRQLFRSFAIDVSEELSLDEYTRFRRDYDSVCQVVRGTHELLQRLRAAGLRLAVMTNNLVSEQMPKLRQLELEDYFEVVSISEEVGSTKPDARIFEVTLDRLSLTAGEAVMVGDSLHSDIAGALGIGMRSVWLNRQPDKDLKAPDGVSTIAEDFADLDASLTTILGHAS